MVEKIDSYTDLQKAFLYFVHQVLSGYQGVFFSNQSDDGDIFWSFGYGQEPVSVSFDAKNQTIFSIFDYKGTRSLHYQFETVFSSEDTQDMMTGVDFADVVSRLEKIALIDGNEGIKSFVEKDETSFEQKVHTIQKAQREGDMWVCNLTHPLCGKVSDDRIVLASFWKFLLSEKSHVGGVFFVGDQKMCSMSPELFLYVESNVLTTKPVKGTHIDKQILLESEKEIAELSMVTDLLRNDIGMIAEKVSVIDERVITPHKVFYHAHAHIEGQLDDQGLTLERIEKLLPAGSITGCPKKRVCAYIERLEGYDRAWYTGIFGVKLPDGRSWYNILIRTLFIQGARWMFPVGGGITHLSNPRDEWDETLLKADSLEQFCFSKKEGNMYMMRILLLGGLLVLDQLTKYWAMSVLSGRIVLTDFFQLIFVKNTGIAFSFPVPLWIVILSAGAVIGFLSWKWLKGYFEWPYALVGIGALGNVIDRVWHGYVIDFISVGRFPVFNFADMYISVGIGLLLVLEYRKKK